MDEFIENLKTELENIDSYEEKVEWIDTQCDARIDKMVDDFATNKTPEQLEAYKARISDYRKSLPLSTGITQPIIGICRQILGFGAAGVALTIGFWKNISEIELLYRMYITIAGIYYLQLMIIAMFVLILYVLQARFRYPFLQFVKIGNSWPFFYYASISKKTKYSVFQRKKDYLSANENYGIDLLRFVNKATRDDTKELIKLELKQFFLLVSLQGYLNQHSLRLANSFIYGFASATIALLIVVLTIIYGSL